MRNESTSLLTREFNMGGRITAFVFAGTLFASCATVLAQGPVHAQAFGGPGNPWAAPDIRTGVMSPGFGQAPGTPPGLPPEFYDPTLAEPPGPVRPATFFPHQSLPGDPGYHTPVREQWWELDPRLREMAADRMRGTYFRAELLFWDFEEMGNRLIGEQLTTVTDPTNPFQVLDLQNPPQLIGSAVVPHTDTIQFKDVIGTRLVFGTPTNIGDFEFEGFLTEQAGQEIRPTEITATPGFLLANSTKIDGQLSNNVQLYDTYYLATFTSELWGLASRFYLEGTDLGYLRVEPTLGFRYVALQESFIQRGDFSQASVLVQAPPGVTQQSLVRADTFNNVYGIEFGMRAEADWWIFTGGVHPWMSIGANTLQNRVTTESFVTVNDPLRVNELDETIFSPAMGLGAYIEARIYDHCTVRAGYDFLWLTRVQRPVEGIDWNIDGTNNTSLVNPERNLNDLLVQGVSVSIEIIIP